MLLVQGQFVEWQERNDVWRHCATLRDLLHLAKDGIKGQDDLC